MSLSKEQCVFDNDKHLFEMYREDMIEHEIQRLSENIKVIRDGDKKQKETTHKDSGSLRTEKQPTVQRGMEQTIR